VKGIKFVNIVDAGDPVEQACAYEAQGADELVFLDITASSDNRETMVTVVSRTAESLFIPFTVGGGIRSIDDIKRILRAGADKIALNTAAIENPDLLRAGADRFGNQCMVLAIDARRRDDGCYEVYTHGGRRPTGMDACEWAERAVGLGAGEILLTSMDRDGTRQGYELELTRTVSARVPVPVIASGGAGDMPDLLAAFQQGGADAVLAASIFHYKERTVEEVKDFLASHGVHVRRDLGVAWTPGVMAR
jgi:cyclase